MSVNHNHWPVIRPESRPWTRWWWPGSAVDKAIISRLLRIYRDAGLGGVEITSIYAFKRDEPRVIDYLAPAWLDMLRHAVAEARRLEMQVDLPPGSGWCIGGPFVTDDISGADLCVERCPDGAGYKAWVQPNDNQVKVPGPGGAGRTFNPFSRKSLQAAIEFFTPALDGLGIRAQFHDSWEYRSDAYAELFASFIERRGYDFRDRLAEYMGDKGTEAQARVKYDLQLTLAEAALENFIVPWSQWCRSMGQLSRNQAHGSPGNLLDLYAAVDIPETETFRSRLNADTPLISKFASSAAHVAGRRLVASETGTWLRTHFQVALADLKALADNLFVAGINHIVYHGTVYSPDDAPWPGWLFYATAQINPDNSIWRDLRHLNDYITRCQTILQSGMPDDELLVYFPFHDVLHDAQRRPAEHLGISGDWLKKLDAVGLLRRLWREGYQFDYVSDRQIGALEADAGRLVAAGGHYRALLVPPCRYMPPETLERLLALSRRGACVIFAAPPADVPGFSGLDERRQSLRTLCENLTAAPDWAEQLADAGVHREAMSDVPGLAFIRRRCEDGRRYFVVNEGACPLDAWVAPAFPAAAVLIMDPQSGRIGRACTRQVADVLQVRLQLDPGASLILCALDESPEVMPPDWLYPAAGPGVQLTGVWQVEFIAGGPELPAPHQTGKLESWTEWSAAAAAFAGTARYRLAFTAPDPSAKWLLDLGAVHSSARVFLNGGLAAALIGPTFRALLDGMRPGENVLEIEVTNLSANRARDLERRCPGWQDDCTRPIINSAITEAGKYSGVAARFADAPLLPAGLLGPVRLIPVTNKHERRKA